jgi:hypothetical protein
MIIAACKKEKSLPPVIEIFEPNSGQQYTQGDTIFYKFSVSDDKAVTNVKALITNTANQAVLTHNFINAGKYKVYEGYFLTESFAVTGTTHQFVVSATDGENETKLGRQIIIYQSERKTIAIFAVTVSNTNSYDIIQIDTLYNIQPVMNSAGDFLKMHVSSKDQIVYSSGKFTGDLYAKGIFNSVLWSEPAISVSGNPAFHNIALYDDLIFVSYDNEIVKAYDKNKSIKFVADAGSGNYAINLIKKDNIILTEERSYPYIETILKSYYFASGAPVKTTSIRQVIVQRFYIKNDDEFVIIGNQNNQGKIFYYNYPANSIWQPYQIPVGDSIIASEFISVENSILIQMTSGLYKFNLSNNNLLPLLPGINYNVLKYDEVRNILITASNTAINFYSYPQLQLIQSMNMMSPVKDIDILYSR